MQFLWYSNSRNFFSGFIILPRIVVVIIVTAVVTDFVLWGKKQSDYSLGLHMTEVAQLARRKVDDI